MSSSERVYVRDVLIADGYPEVWANAKAAPISNIYYHHRRPGPKAPKDSAGIAVYGPEDTSGLLDVARELKDGEAGRPYSSAAPTCDNPACGMWRQGHGGPCEL